LLLNAYGLAWVEASDGGERWFVVSLLRSGMAVRRRVGDESIFIQVLGSLPRWRDELAVMVCRAKLFFAVQARGEPHRAQRHYPRLVGPVAYVLMAHYKVSGFELMGVTPPTRHTLGYWGDTTTGPYMIKSWLNDYVVEKLAPAVASDGCMDWGIDSTASVEAQFFSEAAGIRIGIVGLFLKTHCFQIAFRTEEYEKAADSLKDLEVPSDFVAQQRHR
jgi:hypothetical protein